MAVALLHEPRTQSEPLHAPCPKCEADVLLAVVHGKTVLAEPFEWEPRARCYTCATIESRGRACLRCKGTGKHRGRSCSTCVGSGRVANKRTNCERCGGVGFVGTQRPAGRMLAVDVAWGDDGHVRMIGPNTTRRKGEALYALHTCD